MRVQTFPFTHCRFGVAVRDVTPPVGIYTRSWGAAKHDTADGVHRPHFATAALFQPLAGDMPLLALVALDIGWFQNLQDERDIRDAVMQRAGLSEEQLLVNMSHTHGSVNANSTLTERPGGNLIKPYLARLADQIGEAVLEAQRSMAPAWIAWGYGRCALAQNRDYWDSEAQAWACGYNPERPADDTLLVARVSDEAGHVRATLFNYACHPTTLAWQNHLLSPDFVGAARDVLQTAFAAPALFLQGAEGDVAPRDNYVGDAAVADRNGRQLGYAAAAAIEGLPPPATKFVYTGIMPSGADLGTWAYQALDAGEQESCEQLAVSQLSVDLARKEFPSQTELQVRYDAAPTPREREIRLRRMLLHRALGPDAVQHMPVWLWRLGDAALVAFPNEPYSVVQQALREQFFETPVAVLGVTNGTYGYLPPLEIYGTGIYQEWQSPYKPGCMEKVIEAAASGIEAVMVEG